MYNNAGMSHFFLIVSYLGILIAGITLSTLLEDWVWERPLDWFTLSLFIFQVVSNFVAWLIGMSYYDEARDLRS